MYLLIITIEYSFLLIYNYYTNYERGAKMSAKEQVLNLLKEKNEPMKSGQISEELNLDKKEVDKAIKALKDEGAIISPKRCFYSCS